MGSISISQAPSTITQANCDLKRAPNPHCAAAEEDHWQVACTPRPGRIGAAPCSPLLLLVLALTTAYPWSTPKSLMASTAASAVGQVWSRGGKERTGGAGLGGAGGAGWEILTGPLVNAGSRTVHTGLSSIILGIIFKFTVGIIIIGIECKISKSGKTHFECREDVERKT